MTGGVSHREHVASTPWSAHMQICGLTCHGFVLLPFFLPMPSHFICTLRVRRDGGSMPSVTSLKWQWRAGKNTPLEGEEAAEGKRTMTSGSWKEAHGRAETVLKNQGNETRPPRRTPSHCFPTRSLRLRNWGPGHFQKWGRWNLGDWLSICTRSSWILGFHSLF